MFKWFKKMFVYPTENGYEYAVNSRKKTLYKKYFFLTLFFITSVIAILSTLILAILSTLKLGKLWIFAPSASANNEQLSQFLDNYVYITNTITAIVSLISSFASFFAFKDGYLKNRVLYKKIDFELCQYDNSIGYYCDLEEKEKISLLTDRVFAILGEASGILKYLKDKRREEGEQNGENK